MTIKYDRKAYEDYLKSDKWKDFRKRILKLNYGKKHKYKNHCEMCGWDFADFELEIHHLSYENLFNESVHDVQVLCKSCHKKADQFRGKQTEKRVEKKREDRAFETWAKKVYGEDCFAYMDEQELWDEFQEWLANKEYDIEY